MGQEEKFVGKYMNKTPVSEVWRKLQVMSMKELSKKEAQIDVFFDKCETRIEEKKIKILERLQ